MQAIRSSRGAHPLSVVGQVLCAPPPGALGSGPVRVARPRAQKAHLKVLYCGALPVQLGGKMGVGRGWGGMWWFGAAGRGHRTAGIAVGMGTPDLHSIPGV